MNAATIIRAMEARRTLPHDDGLTIPRPPQAFARESAPVRSPARLALFAAIYAVAATIIAMMARNGKRK